MPRDQRREGRLVATGDEPVERLAFSQSRHGTAREQAPELTQDRAGLPAGHEHRPSTERNRSDGYCTQARVPIREFFSGVGIREAHLIRAGSPGDSGTSGPRLCIPGEDRSRAPASAGHGYHPRGDSTNGRGINPFGAQPAPAAVLKCRLNGFGVFLITVAYLAGMVPWVGGGILLGLSTGADEAQAALDRPEARHRARPGLRRPVRRPFHPVDADGHRGGRGIAARPGGLVGFDPLCLGSRCADPVVANPPSLNGIVSCGPCVPLAPDDLAVPLHRPLLGLGVAGQVPAVPHERAGSPAGTTP